MKTIKSRIHECLPRELLIELNGICYDVTIADNNTKVDMMVSVLDKYDIDYTELGPGTNRFAILLDGFVFKIAMDRYGIKDNWSEFAIAKELQPYVTKTYECNGLIVVAEYVTVISKEEFIAKKDKIRQILSYLAQGYVMGDVGSIAKNFMNWGYRDDGQLTILDFAYIYKIKGDEMICGGLNSDGELCDEFLEYDENFYKLICPKCRKSYTFYDIRKRIDPEHEQKEIDMSKQLAYQTQNAELIIDSNDNESVKPIITPNDINGKDATIMYNKENEYDTQITEEEFEKMYEDAVNAIPSIPMCSTDNVEDNFNSEEQVEPLHIDMDEVMDVADEYLTEVEESIEEKQSEEEDDFYTDPEEEDITREYDKVIESAEPMSEVDYESIRPSTISETVVTGVSEELEEEFGDIKDDPECVVIPSVEQVPSESDYINFDVNEVEEGSIETPNSTSSFIKFDEVEEIIKSEENKSDIGDEITTTSVSITEETTTTVTTTAEISVSVTDNENDEDEEGDEDESEPITPEQSFIKFIDPDITEETEDLRNILRSDIPDEDELDDIYDKSIEENMSYKYSSKRKGDRRGSDY